MSSTFDTSTTTSATTSTTTPRVSSADSDAALLWEVRRYRHEGYEPCIVVYCDRRGDLRLSTTISDPQDVRSCIARVLDTIGDDPRVDAMETQ